MGGLEPSPAPPKPASGGTPTPAREALACRLSSGFLAGRAPDGVRSRWARARTHAHARVD